MILFLPILITLSIGRENFNLEVANTEDQRVQGLMNRATLDKNEGMIFAFPQGSRSAKGPCMWMKNTLISLDIIFLADNGKVLDIIEYADPKTLDARCPKASEEIAYVLELLGGSSARAFLKKGDHVNLSEFLKKNLPID